jgi:nicotinate-nucleotide pyrophosphorylase (carboxylating)
MELIPLLYEDIVRHALKEDLGRAGDLTTEAVVPAGTLAHGRIVNRVEGCIAGLDVALSAFRLLDPAVQTRRLHRDSEIVPAGTVLAELDGSARAILSGERTALNFLGRLSGIATATRSVVSCLGHHKARVVCTRKTTPGLRILEKHAVRAGGGANHRFGLDDAILIKDNHLAVAGSIREAVRRARTRAGHLMKIEVEVDTWEQLEEALTQPIDAVLLDNMSPEQVAKAVQRIGGRLLTEVSGGITPERAVAYAEAGVDLISIGWLTHSAPSWDVSLEVSLKQS